MVKVRFSTRASILSRFMKWFIRGEFSHVEFILSNGKVLGADWLGVRSKKPGPYLYYQDFEVDAPDAVLDTAISQVGKPYDWLAMFGFLVRRDWKVRGWWHCSELLLWAFKTHGVDLLNTDYCWRVSPRDLLLSLEFKPITEKLSGKELNGNF